MQGLLNARLRENKKAIGFAQTLENYADELSKGAHDEKRVMRTRDYALSIRAAVAMNREKFEMVLELLNRQQPLKWWPPVVFNLFNSQAYERYIRARTLEALGRFDEALRWYATLGNGASQEFVYHPISHLKQAEIYDKLDQPTKAIEHYSRFVDLWRNCDPELRPLVSEIAGRLADLKTFTVKE